MFRLKDVRKSAGISQQVLADFLGVTQATLSGWENEKFEIDNQSLSKCADYFSVSIDYLLGRAPQPQSKGVWVPVLGKIQAGIPVETVEEILDYEEITKEMAASGEYFALQIRGDSMQPKMDEGDVVIVRKQEDVDSGDVAVVFVNGNEATVKRIKKRPDGIMLIPYNPAHEVMLYTNAEMEKTPVRIIGKVVELRCKF